jgi:7-cyano-7-deazaguanine synthase
MKTILVYSGGLDSTVLLYSLFAQARELKVLSFNYGQRHSRELEFAKKNCVKLGVEHRVVDLSSIKPLLGGSSQTDPNVDVPEGHYAAENMKLTVVPNRNSIMMNIAAAWAISSKFDTVAYAAHNGDHAIYPDCREEFVDALNKTLALADWHVVQIERPFINMTKGDIVKLGNKLGVPFVDTFSCYRGTEVPCGKCGTDVERRLAFKEAGVIDPTTYADTTDYYLTQAVA